MGNGFKLKEGKFMLDLRKKFYYNGCGETLKQVAQRGNIQGRVEQGSEQPDLIEDVPPLCREVGLDDL